MKHEIINKIQFTFHVIVIKHSLAIYVILVNVPYHISHFLIDFDKLNPAYPAKNTFMRFTVYAISNSKMKIKIFSTLNFYLLILSQ